MVQGEVAIVESMKEEEKSRRKRSVGHCAIRLRSYSTFSVRISRAKRIFCVFSATELALRRLWTGNRRGTLSLHKLFLSAAMQTKTKVK